MTFQNLSSMQIVTLPRLILMSSYPTKTHPKMILLPLIFRNLLLPLLTSSDNEKLPGMLEMLAVFMLKASERVA